MKDVGNCIKYIDALEKNPCGGGGGVFHQSQRCWKLYEMHRSTFKFFPVCKRGLFCHLNQRCSKLYEMHRCTFEKISFFSGGVGGFSAKSHRRSPVIVVFQYCYIYYNYVAYSAFPCPSVTHTISYCPIASNVILLSGILVYCG